MVIWLRYGKDLQILRPKTDAAAPALVLDWIPEGHLVLFILDLVEQLDLTDLYASYRGDGRGQPPYGPAMMAALLFYAYCTGVPSSLQIEKRTHEDVAFWVIAANRHPDHDSSRLSALKVQANRIR